MSLNTKNARELLQKFDFNRLFVEELGWSQPTSTQPAAITIQGMVFTRRQIANLSGVVTFEVTSEDGQIPDAKIRTSVWKETAKHHHENLLIFTDAARTQSVWYWVKRENGKTRPRDHLYVKGQPGDLFLSKLAGIVVDISELDAEGSISVTEVASRLKKALDIEHVTKKFFREFDGQRIAFLEYIEGIPDERQQRWYASVLLNRLMFIWFLQKKGFIDGSNRDYLPGKFAESKKRGKDRFYSEFLRCLFFEGFAKPEPARSADAKKVLGGIRYLNGGLFLPHQIEVEHGYDADSARKCPIRIRDEAFANVFALFNRYSWHLDDRPGHNDNEINPDVLGYIFEKYINQKEFGAYYTRPEITEYLCEQTIYKLVLDRINADVPKARQVASISDLLLDLDASRCRRLLNDILPDLKLLDPACGSGAFLVAAMKTLINLYSAVIGRIEFLPDRDLKTWLDDVHRDHPSPAYYIKKRIITDNLFGVDIMEEATEIAKLRLFLALVAAAQTEDQLEPLPNIDFNILAGNSLIGLLRVDAAKFDAGNGKTGGEQKRMTLRHKAGKDELGGLVVETAVAPSQREKVAAFVADRNAERFAELLEHKNRSIELYRKHAFERHDLDAVTQEVALIQLRADIENLRRESYERLNKLLLDEFTALEIKYEQATWDDKNNAEGKLIKRPIKQSDIEGMHPFHWGFEFDQIMNDRGGFDAIITNPPWEVFETSEKEFFQQFEESVRQKKIRIEDWRGQFSRFMEDPDLRNAWLTYVSGYPHLAKYFKAAFQYRNQIAEVDGKVAATKLNLYKLFTEQCFNLLRQGGYCGTIVPNGIYSDRGAKQLRELMLTKGHLNTVIGLSNERYIFEGVHHAQKFCILTFQKGGSTESFKVAFRINPREAIAPSELEGFLNDDSSFVSVPVRTLRKLSPESLSVPEIKRQIDLDIVEKLSKTPSLRSDSPEQWLLTLGGEFNMTTDSHLFKTSPSKGRLPLYEGKVIHQFEHRFGEPRYWLEEKVARSALLRVRIRELESLKEKHKLHVDVKPKQLCLDYQSYRIGFRDVAAGTNERTMIATVLPPNVFCPHTMSLEVVFHDEVRDGKLVLNVPALGQRQRLYLLAILNSFVADYQLRQKVTNHLSFFFVYQLPVPRLTMKDTAFGPIVERAARLICTTAQFDDLAKEVGLKSHKQGATEPTERAKLRAELDGLIAHLYDLTEEEFAYILTTFPLVPDPVKVSAHNAYRNAAKGLIK